MIHMNVNVFYVTILIAKLSEPALFALAGVIGHAFSMSTGFSAGRSLLASDLAVIATETSRTSACVVANAFAAVHAGDDTFC